MFYVLCWLKYVTCVCVRVAIIPRSLDWLCWTLYDAEVTTHSALKPQHITVPLRMFSPLRSTGSTATPSLLYPPPTGPPPCLSSLRWSADAPPSPYSTPPPTGSPPCLSSLRWSAGGVRTPPTSPVCSSQPLPGRCSAASPPNRARRWLGLLLGLFLLACTCGTGAVHPLAAAVGNVVLLRLVTPR